VYRDQWTAALASAFGTAPHFYDMDNEMDIWGGTHRDVHPNPSGYDELRDTYVTEARALKGWDSRALRCVLADDWKIDSPELMRQFMPE
jgi:hypothetical protein